MGPNQRVICWCILMTLLPGVASLTLEGQKGNNVTFPCDCTAENVSVRPTYGSIIVYGGQVNPLYKGRVHETGHCDLLLRDLKTTDAGRYTLQIHVNGHLLTELFYDVTVNVNLTGCEGEELVFDDLPRGAERVVYSSGSQMGARGVTPGGVQGKELWVRGKGVLDDKLTDSDGRLSIRNFSASDTGAYRVLDAAGGILNTIMVTDAKSMEHHDNQYSGSSTIGVCWRTAVLCLMALLIRYL